MEKTIKALRPPSQRLIYSEPIKIILTDKKIKLQLTEQCFIFSLSKNQPNILYIAYKSKMIRLNKLLLIYTNERCLQKQFIALLQLPVLLQNRQITLIVLETIYIFSEVFNIDLTSYIKHSNLNNLINYYFKLSKISGIADIKNHDL
jgi:hypothetical protein